MAACADESLAKTFRTIEEMLDRYEEEANNPKSFLKIGSFASFNIVKLDTVTTHNCYVPMLNCLCNSLKFMKISKIYRDLEDSLTILQIFKKHKDHLEDL